MAPRQWWYTVYRGLQLPSAGTAAGEPATHRRCARRTRADALVAHRIRPPVGRSAEPPEGARGAGSDRAQTKTRSAHSEPGLGATTRLRQGELRFRRGQCANVHRSNVAGGGPFNAARCRDRFAHLLPQETSAGRNLITVFVHVNNPAQLFSTRLPAPRSMRARGGVPMHGVRRRRIGAALARLIRKLHEKRHLAKTICMSRARPSPPGTARDTPSATASALVARIRADAGRAPDFASHKSICAKTAQAAATHGEVDDRPGDASKAMRAARKNPRRRRRGFVCSG